MPKLNHSLRRRPALTALDHEYSLPQTEAGVPVEKAAAILQQFDRKRRAAATIVPTDDGKVRARLRDLREPITLFGEGPADRRDRLRELLTTLAEQQAAGGGEDVDMIADGAVDGDDDDDDAEDAEEEFYTAGSDALLAARQSIARYSLPRAAKRIAYQKLEAKIPLATHIKHRKTIKERLAGFELYGSQIAGDRPVSMCRFSPDGKSIATGTWSGSIKVLDVPNLEQTHLLRGHTDRIGGIDWFPASASSSSSTTPSTRSDKPTVVDLASGGGEGNIHLWSLSQETPLSTLSGHSARVCRLAFHPSGAHLASASYDTSWRLWDVATGTELLLQEGHSRECYTVAFNGDGSLLASGGLDSIGRVWDLRTGRMAMLLESHVAPVYALAWSPDGHRLLSGSGDGFVKCWDVRAVRETAAVGANTGGVTDLRWFAGSDGPGQRDGPEVLDESGERVPRKAGTFVVSCGFDRSVNVFGADDWTRCKSLKGHSGNVLAVDVSLGAEWIASCGHDRTVKLWARDDGRGI